MESNDVIVRLSHIFVYKNSQIALLTEQKPNALFHRIKIFLNFKFELYAMIYSHRCGL